MTTDNFQRHFFLAVGFLLGSVAPLYGNALNFLLLAFLLWLAIVHPSSFLDNLRQGRTYLLANTLFLAYFALHALIAPAVGHFTVAPAYGTFEQLLLNFILIPLYASTLRPWLTSSLLRRFLFLFALGCLLFNLYVCFHLAGISLLTAPRQAIALIINQRFGENIDILGGHFFLEMRAMTMTVAAFIFYHLFITGQHPGHRAGYLAAFLLLTAFILFTVTKSAIVAYAIGFILLTIQWLRRLPSRRHRLALLGTILALCLAAGTVLLRSDKYEERVAQLRVELLNVHSGLYQGESLAARVAFIKESFHHFDQWSLWGLGVYTKHQIQEWFNTSPYPIFWYNNVHNSFLQFWIMGGIPGLLLVLYLFTSPIVRLFRQRRTSFLLLAILCAFTVVSFSCVTLFRENARTTILLFLALFHYYPPLFSRLESPSTPTPRS